MVPSIGGRREEGVRTYSGTTHTLPLKSKLPPSRETRISSRETRLSSRETRLSTRDETLDSRDETLVSREALKTVSMMA